MTYTKVKLTQPGESLVLAVAKCALATAGNFPGVEFSGTTPDNRQVLLEVPQSSADRQLGRLSLAYGDAVGKTLVFSRDPNPAQPSKAYWGINLAAAQAAKPANGKPALAPESGPRIPGLDDDAPDPEPPEDAAVPETNGRTNPAREKLVASFKLYDACFEHAMKVVRRYRQSDPDISNTQDGFDVAAMAATLFIQANR